MIISKIISTAIEKGRLIVKILGTGSKDIKTVFALTQFGIESRPIKNFRCVYANTGVKGENVLIGLILENSTINEGETKIYSVNSLGVEQNSIIITNTGNIEIGGNADNLSRHSILEAQVHQLRDDLNTHIQNYNSHVHPGVLSGGASTAVTTTLSTESEIDISTAKINNVLTN